MPSGPPWLSWKPGLEADTARRRQHLLGKKQLLPERTYSSGTKALPCLDPQVLLVQGLRFALIRQASWYKGSALRTTPCAGGSSYKQQCMQTACAEAPPAASPASTNGCKGHALVARRRPLLPATMAASGTAAPASHNGCARHGRSCQPPCLPAACAEATPAATPASINGSPSHAPNPGLWQLLPTNFGCERPALKPHRRPPLPTTMLASGMC